MGQGDEFCLSETPSSTGTPHAARDCQNDTDIMPENPEAQMNDL